MKFTKTITTAALLVGVFLSGNVLAQSTGAHSTSGSLAGASNEGNNQNITFEGSSAPSIPHNTPNVSAPALTTTLTETCMGSTSMGGSAAGFGLTFGSTWRDEECVRRLNARELRAMGLGLVAKELMCDNDDIRAAFERAGRQAPALPLCQRSIDERNEMAGKKADVPYTITTRTADPFGNATRHNNNSIQDGVPETTNRSDDDNDLWTTDTDGYDS